MSACLRVAVIGDDRTVANLIVEVLAQGGYDSVVFNDPDVAVAQLTQIRPAIIVLDVRIQHRRACWQLIKQIGEDPRLTSASIVVCTADDGFLNEHGGELAARGVPCLRKPFEIDDLIAAVARAAGRSACATGETLHRTASS